MELLAFHQPGEGDFEEFRWITAARRVATLQRSLAATVDIYQSLQRNAIELRAEAAFTLARKLDSLGYDAPLMGPVPFPRRPTASADV